MQNSLSLLIIFMFIIIITLYVGGFLSLATVKTNSNSNNAGSECQFTSDCSCGLKCINSTCMIPFMSSCNDNPSFCMYGSTCFNGVCLPLGDLLENIDTKSLTNSC